MLESRTSVLHDLVERMAPVRGVVGVILFGSVARGDNDEDSDYDLLVLFEDRSAMLEGWDELFARLGSTNLDVHAIPETLEEVKRSNPVFLEQLRRDGKVLYSRWPMETALAPLGCEPVVLVAYDMVGLAANEKMRVVYHIYGKGRRGALAAGGGVKLGGGCVALPERAGLELAKHLRLSGVRVTTMQVLIEEGELAKARRLASQRKASS